MSNDPRDAKPEDVQQKLMEFSYGISGDDVSQWPQCACNQFWPGRGRHETDCPVGSMLRTQEERIQKLEKHNRKLKLLAKSLVWEKYQCCEYEWPTWVKEALAEDEEASR